METLDIVVLLLILLLLILYNVRKLMLSWKMKKRVRGSRRAESNALKLLEKAGYKVIETQKRIPIFTLLDGQPFQNWVQADYLVEKKGKKYVVEVKTGKEATKVTNPATRRQLLEYYFVYKPDGILLLDMEYGKIQEVSFNIDKGSRANKEMGLTILSFLLGVICTYLILKGGSFFE